MSVFTPVPYCLITVLGYETKSTRTKMEKRQMDYTKPKVPAQQGKQSVKMKKKKKNVNHISYSYLISKVYKELLLSNSKINK